MWGFGSSNLKVGKTYKYNIVVAAVGRTRRIFEGTVLLTPESDIDRETAEADLKADAINKCREELPGASKYFVIKFQEI